MKAYENRLIKKRKDGYFYKNIENKKNKGWLLMSKSI